MVGSKYPYFCNCCIPAVLLKDRSVKYYHLHIMPKLSVSKKLKRSVDDFETPVRVSKAVPVQKVSCIVNIVVSFYDVVIIYDVVNFYDL